MSTLLALANGIHCVYVWVGWQTAKRGMAWCNPGFFPEEISEWCSRPLQRSNMHSLFIVLTTSKEIWSLRLFFPPCLGAAWGFFVVFFLPVCMARLLERKGGYTVKLVATNFRFPVLIFCWCSCTKASPGSTKVRTSRLWGRSWLRSCMLDIW